MATKTSAVRFHHDCAQVSTAPSAPLAYFDLASSALAEQHGLDQRFAVERHRDGAAEGGVVEGRLSRVELEIPRVKSGLLEQADLRVDRQRRHVGEGRGRGQIDLP